MDAATIALLCCAAAVAGWVDAVSGGGGLLQLPSLLMAVPSDTPVVAMATNKLASSIGTATATAQYARAARPDVRTAAPMAVAAIIGALAGASTASRLPAEVIRPIVLVLLVGAWLWTLLSPRMGEQDNLRWRGSRTHYAVAAIAGLAIGFYDGIFGPGTGSFLLFVLVSVLGYSFLRASATAKVVNLSTNLAALAVFTATGSVLWLLGLLMGACNAVGALVGARMAIRKGSGFVRLVFLCVVAVLILRLGWDALRSS